VLLPDMGPSLYESLSRLSPEKRTPVLLEAALWLADLHVAGQGIGEQWFAAGELSGYRRESALIWAKRALAVLRNAADGGCTAVQSEIERLAAMADRVYDHMEEWEVGPTTLIHGDPHLANMVRGQGGGLFLIDWEYASVSVPARDFTVLLQDVWDPGLAEAMVGIWRGRLRDTGWKADGEEFWRTYQAVRFDNTLMMLGHDFARRSDATGIACTPELHECFAVKMGWLKEAFTYLVH
jgi:aminoglycoside phosphotransferase (APT) family kinase protein